MAKMGSKLAVPKVTGNFCYVLLLILVMALPLSFCQVALATETFAASDYFALPEIEGRINFAGGGSYNNASLSNNTWHFTGLTFAGAKSTFPPIQRSKTQCFCPQLRHDNHAP
jgi:hypothetical protein